jgi:hypothetical protein
MDETHIEFKRGRLALAEAQRLVDQSEQQIRSPIDAVDVRDFPRTSLTLEEPGIADHGMQW